MHIKKILNNNAVIAVNEQKQDVIVTGLGIAFQKKKGDLVADDKIEKVFVADFGENSDRMIKLLSEIPGEYVDVAEEIWKYATKVFNKNISKNTVITLADHLYFASKRLRNGLNISNPLIWEVKQYYIDEYKIATDSLGIIEKKLGIEFPEDEIAGIALHLANTNNDGDIPEVVETLGIVKHAVQIIKDHFDTELEDNEISYQRMLTHLKFFAQRIIKGGIISESDDMLYELVKSKYESAFECALKIADYVKEKYEFDVSRSEKTFLTVHIERVISSKNSAELKKDT